MVYLSMYLSSVFTHILHWLGFDHILEQPSETTRMETCAQRCVRVETADDTMFP